MDVVERPFEEETFGGVAVVVQDGDHGAEPVVRDRRELHPRHLERAVADDDERPEAGVGDARPDRRRDGEAHRGVIGGADEFGVPAHRHVGRADIALNAVRIHGGYGYSTEYDVERYFRDAPLMIVGEGTNEIQRNVIVSQLVSRGGL